MKLNNTRALNLLHSLCIGTVKPKLQIGKKNTTYHENKIAYVMAVQRVLSDQKDMKVVAYVCLSICEKLP